VNETPASVEQHHIEMFHGVKAMLLPQNLRDPVGRVEQRRLGQRFLSQALSQKKGALDSLGLGFSNALDLGEFGERGLREVRKRHAGHHWLSGR